LSGAVSLEFPCGSVEVVGGVEEDYETAVHRELAEELGFDGDLEYFGKYFLNIGGSDQQVAVFAARGLEARDEEGDEGEEFEVVRVDAAELERMITDGEIVDGVVLISWMAYKLSLVE